MPAQVTANGPCSRTIKIEITPETIRESLADAWRNAAANVQMKGFRPGKVPRHILEKKYGEQLRLEVKQHLLEDAWKSAIRDHKLRPVESPKVDSDQIELDATKPITLEFTIEVRPDFELPEWRGLEVGAPVVAVQDADLERELNHLRSRFATAEEITEGVVGKGDYAIVDIEFEVDGATVLSREKQIVDTAGEKIAGLDAQGNITSFLGKTKGAKVTIGMTLPDDFDPPGFANAKALLHCTVQEVRRVQLPELDDAFATKVGAENVEDLKTKVRAEIERHLQSQRNRYVEERLFDALIAKTPFDLPQNLVERATDEMVHQLEHQMQHQGHDEARAKADAAAQRDRVKGEQMRALRMTFLVDRIAEAEKIGVTDKELEQTVVSLAMAQQRPAQEVFDELYERGQLGSLRVQILEAKVRKLLREAAKVFDAKTDSTNP